MVKSCFGKEHDAHQFDGNIPVATEAYLKDLCVGWDRDEMFSVAVRWGSIQREEWALQQGMEFGSGWESPESSSCLKRKEEGSFHGEQPTLILRVTWEAQFNAWDGREVTKTGNDQRHESPHLDNLLLSKQSFLSAYSLKEQKKNALHGSVSQCIGGKKNPLLFCLQFIILMYFLVAGLQAEQCCSVKLRALLQLHYYLEAAYIHQLKPEENVGSKSEGETENWLYKKWLTFLFFVFLFCSVLA